MKNILAISHESSLTGAPIVLLHLLKEIQKNGEFEIDIISQRSGPLDDDFRKLAGVYNPSIQSLKPSLFKRKKNIKTYDLIYTNTVASLNIAIEWKAQLGCPLIMHIHEMQNAIEQLMTSEQLINMKLEVDHFIAVSKSVRDNLIELHEIPDNKISLIYESIPLPITINKTEFNEELNRFIKNGSFFIGGSGSVSWRKGTDLFIQTAKWVKDNNLPYKFVWVGGDKNSIEFKQFQFDIKSMGIQDTIILTGIINDPFPIYQLFDLFFLSSREDPFPLVCLENGALAIPVICFKGSGGINELFEDDINCIIPYASISDAGKIIHWFAEHTIDSNAIGLRLQAKIFKNFDIKNAAEMLINIFKNTVAR
ncbi:MAG: glycosyltransferase family 4 protein [Bacteroidales bacterium]